MGEQKRGRKEGEEVIRVGRDIPMEEDDTAKELKVI